MARRKIPRSPRLARLRRQKLFRRTLFCFCLVAVAGLVLYALSRSSFFISEVSISGNSRVPTEAVAALIRRELSKKILGVIPRSHVLLYPKTVLRTRLLSEFPLLAGVTLSANWSSLHAEIAERTPVALWCETERCFYLDEIGFIFAEAPETARREYDRLGPASLGSSTPDALFTSPIAAAKLSQVLELLRRLEALSMNPTFARIGSGGELSVILSGGGELRFPNEGKLDETLTRLAALLTERDLIKRGRTGELQIEYIDLRYGNKIYFKPR